MKVLKLGATITAADFALNALVLAKGKITPLSTGYAVDVTQVSGNENLPTLTEDSNPLSVVTDYKQSDADVGVYVVGLAPRSVIEKEFRDYQIFPGTTEQGTPANLLYRGIAKTSLTEYRNPAYLNTENVIIKQ